MIDFIVAAIVLAILGGILLYLYRAKKRGETCIGCPYAKQCGGGACGGHSRQAKKHWDCTGTGMRALGPHPPPHRGEADPPWKTSF